MNADGTERTRLTEDAALDSRPAWSPDGSRIAYHSDSTGRWSEDEGYISGNEDIWVVSTDGTGKQPLSSGPGRELDPSWSPDGNQLSYQRIEGTESSAIYVTNSDGSGEKRLTDPSIWALSPAWSPDGESIAFSVLDRASTTTDVYVMKADGTGVRQMTDEPPASVFAWSPDASKLLIGGYGVRHSLHTLDLGTGNVSDLSPARSHRAKACTSRTRAGIQTREIEACLDHASE
jgi:Tol biopolymer transport system component